jgi:predicted acyltransferase
MNETQIETVEKASRILSIDVFKGLSITLMTFVNSLAFFENVPAWTRHAGDYGITYVDLIAPFFIFMMALNFTLSFKKRLERFGRRKAYLRFLRRYLIFIGIGLILFLEVDVNTFQLHWGTLQVLGMAGLIHLTVAELKSVYRLIVGSFLIIIHQWMLSTSLALVIYEGIEGGVLGSLSWASIMIFSSVLAEALWDREKWKKLMLGGLIFLFLGIFLGIYFGISRSYMTLPYVLISVGASSVIYYVFHLIFDIASKKLYLLKKERILSASGKNAFVLYIFHLLMISLGFELIPLNVEWLIAFLIAMSNVIIILTIGYLMDKYKFYLII